MADHSRRRNVLLRGERRILGSKRQPFVAVERLWTRLSDLFASQPKTALATTAVLAPRRLEPRRMLDAAAPGLALELLDLSGDFVQAGPDAANLASASATDGAAAQAQVVTPAGSIDILATTPIDEDGVATLEFVYDVPGANTIQIDWGDGSIEEFNVSSDAQLFSTTHQYLDDDPTGTPFDDMPVMVSVIGDDGTVTDQTTIRVNNVDPSKVEVGLTGPIDENGITNLTVTFEDPGTRDSHTIEVNWGDNNIETFELDGSRFFSTTHQYLDDDPTGTPFDNMPVTVRIMDDDGSAVAEGSGTVTVNNVDPFGLQIEATSPIDENGFTILNGSFQDPGTKDVHTLE